MYLSFSIMYYSLISQNLESKSKITVTLRFAELKLRCLLTQEDFHFLTDHRADTENHKGSAVSHVKGLTYF